MKYAVIGAGSVGSLLTYALNQAGVKPYIVFKTDVKARAAREKGLKLILPGEGVFNLRGSFVSYSEIPESSVDVAFVSTKAYDVPSAISSIRMKLKDGAIIISTQNGLGAFEAMKAMLPKSRALALVLNCGAYRKGPYEFVYSGCGESYLGGEKGENPVNINLICDVINALKVITVDDVTPYRWIKLAVNAAVNPLTAINRVRNEAVLSNKYLQSLAISIVKEVKRVAESLRIKLPKDPLDELFRVVKETGSNYSSMLQDILAGRRTEVDFINGVVVGRASISGVEVPTNKVMWLLIRSLERFQR